MAENQRTTTTFMPNPFARCECELQAEPPAKFPICTDFEPVVDEDAFDCCVECRHGERCHLKGHEPELERIQ